MLVCRVFSQVTWQPVSAFPGGNSTVHALGRTSDLHTIIAGSWGTGIYCSTNDGAAWTQTSATEKAVYKFETAPNGNIFALWSNTTGVNISRSTDGGASWQIVYNHPQANNYTYGGGMAFLPGGVYVAALSETFGPLIGDIKTVIARSTDFGASWSQLSLQEGYYNDMSFTGTTVYSACSNPGMTRGVTRTTNGGTNWIDTGFPYFGECIKIDNTGNIYTGIWTGDQVTEKLLKSTDGGGSWSGANLPGGNCLSLFISSNGNIYAGTDAFAPNVPKIRRSTDQSSSWQEVNDGIQVGVKTYSFTENQAGDIFAGTTAGVFVMRNVTGVWPGAEEAPAEFRLEQNYPNPFNPGTVIGFTLKTAEYVNLRVYDISGSLVRELIDGNSKLEAGTHRINFDAGRLSSGIYFYTLSSASGSKTNKMILIK
jgi:hypothetical protein